MSPSKDAATVTVFVRVRRRWALHLGMWLSQRSVVEVRTAEGKVLGRARPTISGSFPGWLNDEGRFDT